MARTHTYKSGGHMIFTLFAYHSSIRVLANELVLAAVQTRIHLEQLSLGYTIA